MVYLTFDDGPGPYTPAVLAILTRTRSTATFFQLGNNRLRYPLTAQAVLAQGSAIGNHTFDHRDLTKLRPGQIRAELSGGPRVHCVRPPYGATNAKVQRIIAERGRRQVLWTDDSLDWTRPGAEAIYRRVANARVRHGTIVLLHDGGGPRAQTVQALPRIIAELQRQGYLLRRLPGC